MASGEPGDAVDPEAPAPLPEPPALSEPLAPSAPPLAVMPGPADLPPTGPRRGSEPGWTLRIVPHHGGEVRQYVVTERNVRQLRLLVGALVAVIATLALSLLLSVPRSIAYEGMLRENLELKTRLQEIDRDMAEIDRILLRLRLYDAQLESMASPRGDHGPIDETDFANAGLEQEEVPLDLPSDEEGPEEAGGLRPAVSWARGIHSRASTFLAAFAQAEPNLSQLMEQLEGLRAVEAALPSAWPAQGTLSSGYGWRRNPFGSSWRFHSGIDVAGNRGTPIRAAAPGKVIRAEYNAGYGRMVEIEHGYGVTTLYGHCHALKVAEGDLVDTGDLIATVGSTGRSTGPHLHFEVRLDGNAVDPLDYLPR